MPRKPKTPKLRPQDVTLLFEDAKSAAALSEDLLHDRLKEHQLGIVELSTAELCAINAALNRNRAMADALDTILGSAFHYLMTTYKPDHGLSDEQEVLIANFLKMFMEQCRAELLAKDRTRAAGQRLG